jgi:hypothetical protein
MIVGTLTSGVLFAPTGPAKLFVTNSFFSRNGNFSNSTGAGIRVVPQSGGSAFVSVEKSVLSGNVYGLAIDTTGGGAGINVTVADSVLGGNKFDGIITVANPGPIGVTVDLTRAVDNGGFGIRSFGAASTIRVARSTITGNATGVAAQNGGQLVTSGSNLLVGNGSDGSFTGSFGAQ